MPVRSRCFYELKNSEENRLSADTIAALAETMVVSTHRNGNTPSGTTYLGQFLAHEMLPSSGEHHHRVAPYFTLRSLYGADERVSDDLFDEQGCFKIGYLRHGERVDYDLPRDDVTGEALIAEPRNDENHIISQLHLTWMRLHNLCVQTLIQQEQDSARETLIEQARNAVGCIVTHITINEFLGNITHREVFEEYKNNNFNTFLLNDSTLTEAPPLFQHAVLRFGHSLVRDRYALNEDTNDAELSTLLNQPEYDEFGNWLPMPKAYQVEWSKLFEFQGAGKFDTTISSGMTSVPRRHGFINMVQHNLNLGNHLLLPSAEQLVVGLKADIGNPRLQALLSINPFSVPEKFSKLGITTKNMPLWLAILLEGSRHEDFDPSSGKSRGTGNKLGSLGSIILLEVALNAINNSSRASDYKFTNNQSLIERIGNQPLASMDLTFSDIDKLITT
ncbi:peroxidase family protein [Agaribacter flavus]|uniref:Peroxidase family protein n=1 Tax=Agaribacter flavus TaxID=1902781 RepID=A0ABV7FQZ8_9ALTE